MGEKGGKKTTERATRTDVTASKIVIPPKITELVTRTVYSAYHPEITNARLIRLSKAFDAEPPWCAKEGNIY